MIIPAAYKLAVALANDRPVTAYRHEGYGFISCVFEHEAQAERWLAECELHLSGNANWQAYVETVLPPETYRECECFLDTCTGTPEVLSATAVIIFEDLLFNGVDDYEFTPEPPHSFAIPEAELAYYGFTRHTRNQR